MPQEFSEIEIPVPYGKIRAKAWGTSYVATTRVLAIHGWQDNAGSFDRLMPLLPESLYIVAIDLPGHGLSSHLPKGCPYHDFVFLMEIKRITEFLKFDKFTILGHSMGAAIGLFFSCLFPKSVERIITIDMVKPLSFPPEELAIRTGDGIKCFLELELKDSVPPVYDEQTSREKLINAHSVFSGLTDSAAECLLKRGSIISSDGKGRVFTKDNRLKALIYQRMDTNALLRYLQSIECELLVIKAKDGIALDSEEVNEMFLKLYERKCQRFKYAVVEGSHHVHLCEPENVASVINEFFYLSINGVGNSLP